MATKLASVVFRALLVATPIFGAVALAHAETPWRRISLFKKIEFDPNQIYTLTEQQGPWMIMAYTFVENTDETKPDSAANSAEAKANQLVQELRTQYGMIAYVHPMDFSFDPGTSNTVDRYGGPRKMKYRKVRAKEVAVLVGDFSAPDDPVLQKTLDRLRHMQSTTIANTPNDENWARDRTVKSWRSLQQTFSRTASNQPLGPMSHAFITSNPKIPGGA